MTGNTSEVRIGAFQKGEIQNNFAHGYLLLKTIFGFVCFWRYSKGETLIFYIYIRTAEQISYLCRLCWSGIKIPGPDDKCNSAPAIICRGYVETRAGRKRLIVFSVVEGDPSNETRVHRSERQKAAGSLTGKMNPTLGHSIGQAFSEWARFEMC